MLVRCDTLRGTGVRAQIGVKWPSAKMHSGRLPSLPRALRETNQNLPPLNGHLEPEDSPFSPPHGESLKMYEVLVARALLERAELESRLVATGRKDKEIASLVCLPSSRPEWALWVVGTRETGFSLLLNEYEVSIWLLLRSGQGPLPTQVVKRQRPMAKDLAAKICEIWKKALSQTRYPEQPRGFGLDGESYHFGYWKVRAHPMAGRTWSPEETTVPGKLVALGRVLKDYVQDTAESDQQIIGRIAKHIAWFETQGQN